MSSLENRYQKLIQDTAAFLKQEHSLTSFVPCTKEQWRAPVIPKQPVKKVAPQPSVPIAPIAKSTVPIPKQPPPQSKISKPLPELSQRKAVDTDEMADLKKLCSKELPNFVLKETTPNDEKAHRLANRWRLWREILPVAILQVNFDEATSKLLNNLTAAISQKLLPAKILNATELEKSNQWELFLECKTLQVIIANPKDLKSCPSLLPYYQKNPQNTLAKLGNVLLIEMQSADIYLSSPEAKRELWSIICKLIKR